PFALAPASAARVVAAVRGSARYDIPVFAKLSPDAGDIAAVGRACVAAGADGLSMINTLPGMAIDPVPFRPALAGLTGGLSGPAIRPVAVRCVWLVREALPDVPVIGCGGVRTGRDALEFLLAGASMVAVGTVLFHDPSACSRIQRELEEEPTARGVDRVADVIGRAHEPAAYAAPRAPGGGRGAGRPGGGRGGEPHSSAAGPRGRAEPGGPVGGPGPASGRVRPA